MSQQGHQTLLQKRSDYSPPDRQRIISRYEKLHISNPALGLGDKYRHVGRRDALPDDGDRSDVGREPAGFGTILLSGHPV